MKMLLALCFTASSIGLAADAPLHTFTSPDGVFRFQYSPVLVRCTAVDTQAGHGGQWVPADCSGMAPVCDDPLSAASTIACFAYPRDRFKDKPTFDVAAFFVAEVNATEEHCMDGSSDWNADRIQDRKVNGVASKLFHATDVWTGHSRDAYFYRVLHNSKCYELSEQFENTNPGAYDPGIKLLTRQDWKDIEGRLNQIIRSFRFLR